MDMSREFLLAFGLPQSWWDNWWELDYSWNGLSKKIWIGWAVMPDGTLKELRGRQPVGEDNRASEIGGRQATLQDYWRDQSDDLIQSPCGKKFTKYHLPPPWHDPTTSAQQQWPIQETLKYKNLKKLDDAVAQRLMKAQKTEFDGALVVGPDYRAQFQGVFLRGFNRESCALKKFQKKSNDMWELSSIWSDAGFDALVDFEGVHFVGNVDFEGVYFHGATSFHNIIFSGMSSFDGSNLAAPQFYDVNFLKEASFKGASFIAGAEFIGCTFKEIAKFQGAVFKYYEDENIESMEHDYSVRILRIQFFGQADFRDTRFFGNQELGQAVFKDEVDFTGSNISNPFD